MYIHDICVRISAWVDGWCDGSGQGPTALAEGTGGGYLEICTLMYPFFPLSPSLWETVRYRLKYCLKGPLNPKQPTNQRISAIGKGRISLVS